LGFPDNYNNLIMKIDEILHVFDSEGRKNFEEHDVNEELKKFLPRNRDDISQECLAELIAFDFSEDYQNDKTGWGTYFGPMWVINSGDGTVSESPSINQIKPEIIDYWRIRAKASRNPILIARYSGLVFDFQYRICGTNPSFELVRIYIDSLIQIADMDYHKNEHNTISKLKRALGLSKQYNQTDLIEKCKLAIMSYEDRHGLENKPTLWGHSFDLLVGDKLIRLSEREEIIIIRDLELKLDHLGRADLDSPKINPWAIKAAATRLASYYKKKGRVGEVKRVILKVSTSFDRIINHASPLEASNWLEQLYKLFDEYDLRDQAEGVLVKLRELGPKVASELKPIETSIDLPREEIEAYINAMTSGSIGDILNQVVARYIPDKVQTREQILDLSKVAPLQYLFEHQITDDKGRMVALVGSLENDLEGHIVFQVSQNLSSNAFLLRMILQRSIERLGLSKVDVLKFIENCPILDKERMVIIERGLDAYFENDFISAIHLLIPQIEEALRNLVEFSGGNILKPINGIFQLIPFGQVLKDDILVKVLGEDISIYFQVLFTDQRGWNLRNDVCHGMAKPSVFNHQTADRVLHAFLCLGLVQEKGKTNNLSE